MSDGYVKSYRKIKNWQWYTDVPVCHLFQHLVREVNHKDNYWRGELIKTGQIKTSINHLSVATGLTNKQIRNSLKKLNNTGEIISKGASNGTVITVVNYSNYQALQEEEGEQEGKRRANEGQTKGKRRATNKNDKNDKNDKNIYSSKFIKPKISEIEAYCQARKNSINAQAFYDYNEAKGWIVGKTPMKDWKATVRTWENNQKNETKNGNSNVPSWIDRNPISKNGEIDKEFNEEEYTEMMQWLKENEGDVDIG